MGCETCAINQISHSSISGDLSCNRTSAKNGYPEIWKCVCYKTNDRPKNHFYRYDVSTNKHTISSLINKEWIQF